MWLVLLMLTRLWSHTLRFSLGSVCFSAVWWVITASLSGGESVCLCNMQLQSSHEFSLQGLEFFMQVKKRGRLHGLTFHPLVLSEVASVKSSLPFVVYYYYYYWIFQRAQSLLYTWPPVRNIHHTKRCQNCILPALLLHFPCTEPAKGLHTVRPLLCQG